MPDNHILIETHYGLQGHQIRAITRNLCSESVIEIIYEVARIVYPDDEFDVFFNPSVEGSYKDTVRIVAKNAKAKSVEIATGLGLLVIALLTYLDTHSEHNHEEKMRIVDDTAKCISLQQQIKSIEESGEILLGLDEEKISAACGNIKIKKMKNQRYETLQNDDMIESDEIIMLKASGEPLFSRKIERSDFERIIEYIPQNEDYTKDDIGGVIELISPVVKQKKEGKGKPRAGVYYGETIIDGEVVVLQDGEEINFYMQDDIFKSKIELQQVKFGVGDSIRASFTLRGNIKYGILSNKHIYVSQVQAFNEDVIVRRKTEQDNGWKAVGLFEEQ